MQLEDLFCTQSALGERKILLHGLTKSEIAGGLLLISEIFGVLSKITSEKIKQDMK